MRTIVVLLVAGALVLMAGCDPGPPVPRLDDSDTKQKKKQSALADRPRTT